MMLKQMKKKRLLLNHRISKGASQHERQGFIFLHLQCRQDIQWGFIPWQSKGIRQPGLLLLQLHLPGTPFYCSAHCEVFICLHLKVFPLSSYLQMAALSISTSPQLCHLERLTFTSNHLHQKGMFRFAQKSTLAGLGENKDFLIRKLNPSNSNIFCSR